jgi:hypothetical protein
MLRTCVLALIALILIPAAHATDSNMGESSEISFCNGDTAPYAASGVAAGCVAADLRTEADTLASPAAIFEYVRNNYDFRLYHGARSGSVNTFLGGRGNDVDLAATLIAMLRSQGVPAHYVVGTVSAPVTQMMNWLQVEDPTLAKSLLVDQGIQGVVSSTSGTTPTLNFEHVWVEALVPYGQYRGEVNSNVSCAVTPIPSVCHWVPMDPSWKQYVQINSGLDPYSTLSFDYINYYNAIVNANTNGDTTRLNKNPLEIYQAQVLSWLSTAAPGKTLDDIPDFQDIVTQTNGLLPASLPYAVVSATTRIYNSVGDHDLAVPATEPKKWNKYVTVTPSFNGVSFGGFSIDIVSAATQRLTFTYQTISGTSTQAFYLGGTQQGGGGIVITSNLIINGEAIQLGSPLTLNVTMDGPPDPTGGSNDYTITASYQAMIGGYYLIATGGDSSNWSQVHRAAAQLLAANTQYPIVYDGTQSGCNVTTGYLCNIAYVGSVAPGNNLLNNKPAMDALTGGLLYVASAQYFAQLRDDFSSADSLNKVATPIFGFLGVVSSTDQPVEYIDSTAFSILPSGLLIDMKGIATDGSWRINAPSTLGFSNRQFAFLGHITSSLEHETWQALTGYDAISTVRGIQMALANGATLIDIKKNQTTDTMAAAYTAFGFTSGAAPAGFTYTPFNLFGTQPATWTNATNGAGFDLMLAQVSTSTSALNKYWENYAYFANAGFYGYINCVNNDLIYLKSLNSTLTGSYEFCDHVIVNDTVANIITEMQADYLNTIIPTYIGQTYFNYFDVAQGFAPASYVYRATPIAANAPFSSFVATIRNNLYLQDLTKAWVEYLTPSLQSVGPNYKFAVDIRYGYDAPTGDITTATFEILNNTGIAAGGGFVGLPGRNRVDDATGSSLVISGKSQ